jgi:hypothetical protein
MRALVVALLALLIVSVDGAAAKDPNAPERVLWNSTPDDVRAGGAWNARLSLLQGPGGFYSDRVHPVIVVTDLDGGAERRVPMTVDLSPNTFKATVPFPRAGLYEVAVAGFDPRDPARFADTGPPVRIRPAASRASAGVPWGLAAVIASSALLLVGTWAGARRSEWRAERLRPPAG